MEKVTIEFAEGCVLEFNASVLPLLGRTYEHAKMLKLSFRDALMVALDQWTKKYQCPDSGIDEDRAGCRECS
jgi:hypothetical protein